MLSDLDPGRVTVPSRLTIGGTVRVSTAWSLVADDIRVSRVLVVRVFRNVLLTAVNEGDDGRRACWVG